MPTELRSADFDLFDATFSALARFGDTLLAPDGFSEGVEMAEPWSSVDQVATHLGVVQDSVYRWIEARGLPAHRIGRLWKFKISEVDAWVRAGGAKDREPQVSKTQPAKVRRSRP